MARDVPVEGDGKDDAARADVWRMVEQLRDRLDEGGEALDQLCGELVHCRQVTADVLAIVEATIRHTEEAVAVVDADLAVRFASPAAVALLGGDETDSLHAVLPRGGAFALRRFLGVAAEGDGDHDRQNGHRDRRATQARPRGRMRLAGDGVEVSVRRVEPVLGSLGGLWGAAPSRAHGLVHLTVRDAAEPPAAAESSAPAG